MKIKVLFLAVIGLEMVYAKPIYAMEQQNLTQPTYSLTHIIKPSEEMSNNIIILVKKFITKSDCYLVVFYRNGLGELLHVDSNNNYKLAEKLNSTFDGAPLFFSNIELIQEDEQLKLIGFAKQDPLIFDKNKKNEAYSCTFIPKPDECYLAQQPHTCHLSQSLELCHLMQQSEFCDAAEQSQVNNLAEQLEVKPLDFSLCPFENIPAFLLNFPRIYGVIYPVRGKFDIKSLNQKEKEYLISPHTNQLQPIYCWHETDDEIILGHCGIISIWKRKNTVI